MEVTLELLDGLQRRLNITVSGQEFASAFESKLNSIQKTIKMDGFRAGKVPLSIIKSKYGQSIKDEVVGDLADKRFQAAMQEQKQKPASQPKLDKMPEPKPGETFTFSVTYEVFPEFDLVELDGQAIDKEQAEVQDADVESTITRMRDQHATWISVDRPAKNGDKIIIDFEGSMNGEKFVGGSSQNFELTLGSHQMIPGFEDALMGSGSGDQTTIHVTFPSEYNAPDLAGKPADFAISVHQVLEKQPMENDAELLKKLEVQGDMQTLREQVKKHMSRELESVLTHRLHDAVFNKLSEVNSFDVPKTLVEQEARSMVRAQLQQYLGVEGFKKFANMDMPLDPFMNQAEKRIRLSLLLEKVIQKHQIKVNSAKVRSFIEKIAEAYDEPDEVISHYYSNSDALAGIRHAAAEDAAVEALLAKATVNIVQTDYETLLRSKAQQG
jgi:trigger factor